MTPSLRQLLNTRVLLTSMILPLSTSKLNILLYNDEGASPASTNQLECQLRLQFPSDQYHIVRASGAEVLHSMSQASINPTSPRVSMLCVGGGYDLGMLKKLRGEEGGSIIQQFIRAGGIYYGVCAGAYFACGRVRFEEGGELEVMGERFIRAIEGDAIGPLIPGFRYGSESGSFAVQVNPESAQDSTFSLPTHWKQLLKDEKSFHAYLNGGPYFQLNAIDKSRVQVLYRYAHNGEAAILACPHGRGVAILSGVHLEMDSGYVGNKWASLMVADQPAEKARLKTRTARDLQANYELLHSTDADRADFCQALFTHLRQFYFAV